MVRPVETPPRLLELVVSQQEAEARIDDRIAKGRELLQQAIRCGEHLRGEGHELLRRAKESWEQLHSAERDYGTWYEYNMEMLKRIFTNASLAHEYSTAGVGFADFSTATLGDRIRRLRHYAEEGNRSLQSIKERLDLIPVASSAKAQSEDSQTIVFTDIARSTELMRQLGDAAMRDLLREHERITRDRLSLHGGTEIKLTGDGFLASFGSATRALKFAVELQRALVERNKTAGVPLRLRIGINAGEPIAEEHDLFGIAVNTAARIAEQAKGDEILVADVVRQLVDGKGFVFTDRDCLTLKGLDAPVRVWELRWQID